MVMTTLSISIFNEEEGYIARTHSMDTDLIIDTVYHRVIGYEYRPLNDIRRALYTYRIGI